MTRRSPWSRQPRWLGLGLVGLSLPLFLGVLLVPLLPLPIKTKMAISASLLVLSEAAFWIGGLILGKDFLSRLKGKLNPLRWFHRKDRAAGCSGPSAAPGAQGIVAVLDSDADPPDSTPGAGDR